MAAKKGPSQLGRREREILDIVFRLEEASVGDVVEQMADPPAYDSVRTMLRLLMYVIVVRKLSSPLFQLTQCGDPFGAWVVSACTHARAEAWPGKVDTQSVASSVTGFSRWKRLHISPLPEPPVRWLDTGLGLCFSEMV